MVAVVLGHPLIVVLRDGTLQLIVFFPVSLQTFSLWQPQKHGALCHQTVTGRSCVKWCCACQKR